jgi:predicted alpha/beta-hydrolase family hydrolase
VVPCSKCSPSGSRSPPALADSHATQTVTVANNPDNTSSGGAQVRIVEEPGLRGFLHRSEQPNTHALLLTHGAGSNCRSPLLTALANEFCTAGFTVLRYDLPFRQLRPTGPPMRSAEKDQQGIAAAIEWMKRQVSGRIFAGGHSYGGRMTTMLAASRPELAAGLLLLSYPLHPPKAPAQVRTAHFPQLQTPSLFVHGTRDGFGTVDEMTAALQLIPARTQLLPIEGAGHELLSKRHEQLLPGQVAQSFVQFFAI